MSAFLGLDHHLIADDHRDVAASAGRADGAVPVG
jgi:hypothetical protein